MAAASRLGLLAKQNLRNKLIQSRNISSSSVLLGEWNYNWQPGPYPKTRQEKAAEAAKYGLLPHDYEPLPDDGSGHGGYVKLPDKGAIQRSHYYDWDDHAWKRDFMDPVHIHEDVLQGDRCDPEAEYPYSWFTMFSIIVASLLGFGTLWMISWKSCKVFPMMDKQYPYDDLKPKLGLRFVREPEVQRLKHYTFEPVQ